MLSRLCIAALWSPAGKGLTSWLSFVMLNSEFVTFPCCILGQVWYLIELIPDLCHISYYSQGHNTVEVGINPLPLTPEIEVLPLGHYLANDQMHSHSL